MEPRGGGSGGVVDAAEPYAREIEVGVRDDGLPDDDVGDLGGEEPSGSAPARSRRRCTLVL